MLAGVALLALAGILGWWWTQPASREPPSRVLLITVDTLRADALGCYGSARARTPWIDRLAAGGARFTDAHASSVMTLPSHATILSGRYPLTHGVRDNAGFRFPADLPTLATLLSARGFRTGAFVSAFPLDSRFGLARGFDVYDDQLGPSARPTFLEQERPGPATVARALDWLRGQAGHPVFCWVHVYEPHYPYAPPEPYASRFRGHPYDGDVAAADAALGPLLDPILASGKDARTLVVLTADHGESLGEHGEATHGIFAYEATLRVPLILYLPRRFGARVVRATARHVDLLPTILEALGLPIPTGLPGRSLLAEAAGAASPEPPVASYFEALSGELNRGWAPLRGVLEGDTKYIDLPIPELYDLAADPGETRNLAAAEPAKLAAMRRLLAPFRAQDRGVARREEDAETRERLATLGYLGGGAGAARGTYTEADDPKRLIGLDARLREVVGLSLDGKLQEALARCRALVREAPGMPLGFVYLGQLERQAGDFEGAAAALSRAVALAPRNVPAVSLLGAVLTQAGHPERAVAFLTPYAQDPQPDLDVLTALGLALARTGKVEAALAALSRARQADPSNPMVLVSEGTVRLMARQPAKAREAFEAALALDPSLARAESSLAALAAQAGEVPAALAHWRRAVALDPGEYGTAFSLGGFLARQGRTREARPILAFFAEGAPSSRFAREIAEARRWLAAHPADASDSGRAGAR